ncbi:MAG: TIGR02281 family clan AA aspartic protease [Gammaproteobacteria bacterium]|jgi:aspartyl protease family protein|nr:TIGR02281 family clan AA aspartic protease [Gammaproteobacteria bacterium]MBT3725628.1 TIGR02281 family clan AA aspartic protease [Gammaproteobacteria bacterium]MBT4078440.1 TIGR02281 family clan AA aspartic protease [Gammaproteobacteria bacterium]MBT4195655.1 TIGR02281 family clan AA aspartic protease [Gammaproteobacteria bacterium]MBT4449205.1 TIGR02281 family clan AA aspartic protease [Gammaproteobacteria bacterium]
MSHSTRKLGNAFTWLGWIIGFFMLALLFDQILEQKFNPNQSINTLQTGSYQEITLKRNRQGHYIFNGLINNKVVTFLVDTGATTTSIPANLATKLNLKKGHRFTVQTANGNSFAYSTIINSLKIGDMKFNNVSASLNPGLLGNEILLGMNILKNIELIQRGDTLILRK